MSTIKTIEIQVSGLDPANKYRFKFNNKGGNWPVRVTPLSGIFYPNKVKTYVYFCSTTGECPSSDPNVFYNVPQPNVYDPGLSIGSKSLYSVLDLSITDYDNLNEVLYTHPCIIECDECLPSLSSTTDSITFDIRSGNSVAVDSDITGLIPNQSYKYKFSGVGGNWPVKIIPVSGTIKSNNESMKISNLVTLCSPQSACSGTDPNVLNYGNASEGSNREDIYSVVNLTITSDNNLQSSSVSSFSVLCDECLPHSKASIPNIIDFGPGDNHSSFDTLLENLIVGQEYSYSFDSVEANWPVVVQPRSGVITATSPYVTIPTKISFCPSTGLCPNGSSSVLSYAINVSSDIRFGLLDKKARLKLNVKQLSNNISIYSNELSAFCNDCVSIPKASMPSMITLAEGTDRAIFDVEFNNLIPGSKYQYVFQSIDSNWPVTLYPMSGILNPVTINDKITAKAVFCRSTGICPSSDDDVLNYVTDSACPTKAGYINRNIKLKLELDPLNYDANTIYSNELSIVCENCLPVVDVILPTSLVLEGGNSSANIAATLTNLIPGFDYSYQFESVTSNWPSIIYPSSGIIRATSSTETVVSKLTFCPSTGTCPTGSPNVLSYSLDPLCSNNINGTDKNTKLKLKIQEKDCNSSTVYSNECRVSCDDCLNLLSISQDSVANLNTFGISTYTLNTTLNNLIPGETYKYTINRVDSNWPVVVSRQSGEFKAVSNNKLIKTDIGFCYPSGLCANDTRDTILAYKENSLYDNSKNKFLTLNMNVIQQSCSTNQIIYSNDFTLNCNNCLPITDYIVLFSGAPVLSLPVGCCSGTKLLSVDVSNGIPGDNHFYQFTCASSDVTLTPNSGNLVFQSNGRAKLLTVANINLETHNQAVVQFKLTNTTNPFEAMDYLAIRCGQECV